jgi:hypothetical protein
MMMKNISIILLCFFFFACSKSPEAKIPDTVLSKEKMAELMLDIQLYESTLSISLYKEENVVLEIPKTNILKKHGVSKKQYDESFDYYSHHPDVFAEVYTSVLNDLSRMQAEVKNGK